MRKRLSIILLIIIMTVFLAGCSVKGLNRTNSPIELSKEGIAPYKLTEREKYLLLTLGIDSKTPIISFNAPIEAITLDVKVYQLEDDGNWGIIGGGSSSIGMDLVQIVTLTFSDESF